MPRQTAVVILLLGVPAAAASVRFDGAYRLRFNGDTNLGLDETGFASGHALPAGSDPAETAALLETWKYVDYFVSGSFVAPGFLEGPGATFHVDGSTGTVHAAPRTVTFFLAVPKERPEAGHLAPFPVALAGHGYGSNRLEPVLAFGGKGVAATRRFDDADAGAWAALPGHPRCDPGADCTGEVLADPGGYSCGAAGCSDGLQAPRLDPPLRQQLVRQSTPAGPCPVNARAGCYSTGASACTPSAPGASALLLPLLERNGLRNFGGPKPAKPFDMDQFIANAAGRYFECRGRELRFDQCQQDLASCPWIPPPPP